LLDPHLNQDLVGVKFPVILATQEAEMNLQFQDSLGQKNKTKKRSSRDPISTEKCGYGGKNLPFQLLQGA
jgi:hypothetical protein